MHEVQGSNEPLGASSELITRAKAGDARARDQLFERYLPRLQRWARGRLPRWARDLSETDDIVQEALTGVFRRIDDFEQRGEGAFGAYARQAIYNRIRDEIRRNQRRPRGEQSMDRIESDAVSPIERVIGRERMERFDQGLERLPAEYREAIVGRFELGLTYEELAREIGRPSPDAARMLVKRGIHKLAEEIADAGQ